MNPLGSWTTTKGESTSTTVVCPNGGKFTCGMMVSTMMKRITGEFLHEIAADGHDCNDYGWQTFTIESIGMMETASNVPGDGSLIEFDKCVALCESPEACKVVHDEGMVVCPGWARPKDYIDPEFDAAVDSLRKHKNPGGDKIDPGAADNQAGDPETVPE